MQRPVLTSGPVESPVSLQDAKDHLRIVFSDDDATILSMIGAAVSYLDGWSGVLGRCIVSQTWTVGLRAWPSNILLPFPDVSAVVITYLDGDGIEQAVAGDVFEITHGPKGGSVEFKDAWSAPSLYDDSAEPITVSMTAGYGAASDVPYALKMAILMLVGHFYQNREAVSKSSMSEMPLGFEALVAPFRVRLV